MVSPASWFVMMCSHQFQRVILIVCFMPKICWLPKIYLANTMFHALLIPIETLDLLRLKPPPLSLYHSVPLKHGKTNYLSLEVVHLFIQYSIKYCAWWKNILLAKSISLLLIWYWKKKTQPHTGISFYCQQFMFLKTWLDLIDQWFP